jgi:hypothetical protein|nr:MAG TPA: hypothetical protein [Caudoviricetes sp.]
MNNNSNINGEMSALDILSVFSTIVNLLTYDKVITKDFLVDDMKIILDDIHSHLDEQDMKIDKIIEEIGGDNVG